jgi:hypothetical protein
VFTNNFPRSVVKAHSSAFEITAINVTVVSPRRQYKRLSSVFRSAAISSRFVAVLSATDCTHCQLHKYLESN